MNMPPSPSAIETRPEYKCLVTTSVNPLSDNERLMLWRAKKNIIELEAWKQRTREVQS